jgi:DNA polymerase-3 subunit epsilon
VKVEVKIVEKVLEGDNGNDVLGIEAACTRCGHTVEVFGTGEASIKRGCAMLRDACPRGERNFYMAGPSNTPTPKKKSIVTIIDNSRGLATIILPSSPEPAWLSGEHTMYLFFDTETTGIPAGADSVHMVQLAWELWDDTGEKRAAADFIIRPEGFKIDDKSKAVEIHGITQARAMTEGWPLENVMSLFAAVVYMPVRFVGHNINFDRNIILKEYDRLGWTTERDTFGPKESLCTMSTDSIVQFCGVRKADGSLKWPKLNELYPKLFNRNFADAHNAKADIAATSECFWELRRKGLI